MANPNCFACEYREARTRGLCYRCHDMYTAAGMNLTELRRRKEDMVSEVVSVMANRLLRRIKRDPDDVIAWRRQELRRALSDIRELKEAS
jgi:hypothetical protein